MSLLILMSLLIVGCSNKESADNETQSQVQNETTDENASDSKEENVTNREEVADEATTDEEKAQDEGYKIYRPEVGDKRIFTENGSEIFSEEIVAENDEYIQMLVTLGANKTLEIYKWTEDEISLVYQEFNPSDASENRLTNFESDGTLEVLVSQNDEADWELVEEGTDLEIDGQTYSEVFTIQKVSEEVEGETTTYIKYFAPGKGLIKDVIEVTGEYGYTSESILSE